MANLEYINKIDMTASSEDISENSATLSPNGEVERNYDPQELKEKRLKEKELYLEITKPAVDFIIENGYNPTYGARPLKRFIQSKVETLVAKSILKSELKPNDVIVVDELNGELNVFVK